MKADIKSLAVVLIMACFGLLPASSFSAGGNSAAADSSDAKFDIKKRREEMNLFLDKIDILGKIEKPQTVFIVQGKDPTVEDIQIDRSFFKEIFRKVEKEQILKVTRKLAKGKAASR